MCNGCELHAARHRFRESGCQTAQRDGAAPRRFANCDGQSAIERFLTLKLGGDAVVYAGDSLRRCAGPATFRGDQLSTWEPFGVEILSAPNW